MRKEINYWMALFGLVLVFGLATALTSCDLDQTAEISVTNASQFPGDQTVTVSVLMAGRNDALQTRQLPRDQTVTFSLDAGDYRVRVSTGGGTFWYPQNQTAIHMQGNFRLRFNGNSVTRTN